MNLVSRAKRALATPIGAVRAVSAASKARLEKILKEDEQSVETVAEVPDLPYKDGKNISGLNPEHRRKLHGVYNIHEEPKHRLHNTVAYRRKVLARDGLSSGVDPALCWMDREAFEEAREKESLLESVPIKVMIENAAKKKAEEREIVMMRQKQIEEKLLKMDKWKDDLEKRVQKKFDDARRAKEKKEKLVEEVRRHFGFKVDPKDERFQQLLEQKEKQQKKEEKLAKKAAKEAAFIAKLQQQSANVSTEK